MTIPQPFERGFADAVRASSREANERLGNAPEVPFDPLSVRRVTATVSEGNPALVARLLDPRPIGDAEWEIIERSL